MTKTRAVTHHYQTLGVAPGSSPDEIRDVFTSLIRQYRERPGEPDRGRVERAREIKMAYATLSDPMRRRAHDEELGIAREPRRGASSPFFAAPASVAAASAAGASEPVREPNAEAPAARQPEPPPVQEAPPAPEPVAEPFPAEPMRSAYVHDDRLYDEPMEDRPRRRNGVWIAAAGALLLAGTAGTLALLDSDDTAEQANSAGAPQSQVASRGDAAPAASSPLTQEPLPEELADAGGFTPFQQVAPAGSDLGTATDVPLPAETDGGDQSEATTEAGSDEAPADTPVAEDSGPPPPAQVQPSRAEPPAEAAAPPPVRQPSRAARARYVSGGLNNSDNPGGRFVGAVGVRLTVGPNGRVINCRAERSSGNAELDARTCRLAQQRITFDPARNDEGTPVQTEVLTTYTWGRRPRP